MKWTNEKPTKPGWYWLREFNIKRPVEIFEFKGKLFVFLSGEQNIVPRDSTSQSLMWSDSCIEKPE